MAIVGFFACLADLAHCSHRRLLRPLHGAKDHHAPLNLSVATATDLQKLLASNQITSVELVTACLKQIELYDGYLKAVVSTAPSALETARLLDVERQKGIIRGPLHGIPILIKDNIATDPTLGMDTTAGSFALKGSRPKGNADVVNALVAAGMIVLGKAQLSEFAFYKGTGLPCGWSAVRGQCQSAYTTDDVQPDDLSLGYSSPGGSSTGSAVAVSAGYAPIAVGTDTTGSVIIPSTRAALYGMRYTQGKFSMEGVFPVSRTFDSLGMMAKTPRDLADITDALTSYFKMGGPKAVYANSMSGSWKDLRVGVVAPEKWKWSPELAKPNKGVESQLVRDTHAAYKKIERLAKRFQVVELISADRVEEDGKLNLWSLFKADFETDLNSYLESLEYSKVRSLADIIQFNKENADHELPEGYSQQDRLEGALGYRLPSSTREALVQEIRSICREQGIGKTLDKYDVDVILGPADSPFNLLVCGGGYPSATMPLSYLDFNGRPTGVFAVAREGNETLLLNVMSAWESTFPPRKPPTLRQP